jgi:hypothetical protein
MLESPHTSVLTSIQGLPYVDALLIEHVLKQFSLFQTKEHGFPRSTFRTQPFGLDASQDFLLS